RPPERGLAAGGPESRAAGVEADELAEEMTADHDPVVLEARLDLEGVLGERRRQGPSRALAQARSPDQRHAHPQVPGSQGRLERRRPGRSEPARVRLDPGQGPTLERAGERLDLGKPSSLGGRDPRAAADRDQPGEPSALPAEPWIADRD